MGCSPSTNKNESEAYSQVATARVHFELALSLRTEISELRIKRMYNSSNSNSRDLKTSAVMAKTLSSKIEEIQNKKTDLTRPVVHKKAASASLSTQELQNYLNSSFDLENLLSTELETESGKTEILKKRLRDVQDLLKLKKEKFQNNLKEIKDVVACKKLNLHRKNLSEKIADSTFYTSGNLIENSYMTDKNLLKTMIGLKCASQLNPEVINLKGKILMRDELSELVTGYFKRYESTVKKVQQLKSKLQNNKCEDRQDLDGDLKKFKSRIFVMEKEIENDKQEQKFLKTILNIGKKFSEFQSKTLELSEKDFAEV